MIDHGLRPGLALYGGPAIRTRPWPTYDKGDAFISTQDEVAATEAIRSRRYFRYDTRPHEETRTGRLDYPIFGFRMDEIRAALADALLRRLPRRLELHRRNHDDVAERLDGLDGVALRRPVAEGAYLGEALIFRLRGASPEQVSWFARALRAEGIDARALGCPQDTNVRAFWNWRFLVGPDPELARSRLPRTTSFVREAIDIPLSANLTREDCDQLVAAVRKVITAWRPDE